MSGWLGLRVEVLVFQLEALCFLLSICSEAALFQGWVLSSPALSWFWTITQFPGKFRVSELKGVFNSKGSIPFELQIRKLRQGQLSGVCKSQMDQQGLVSGNTGLKAEPGVLWRELRVLCTSLILCLPQLGR